MEENRRGDDQAFGILQPNISDTQLSNTSGIQMMFSRFGHKFDLMYAKTADVHNICWGRARICRCWEHYESLLNNGLSGNGGSGGGKYVEFYVKGKYSIYIILVNYGGTTAHYVPLFRSLSS